METLINTKDFDEYKSIVVEQLKQSQIRTDNIIIPLQEGEKHTYTDYTSKKNRRDLSQINGNYGIYPAGELFFVDIDNKEQTPDKLIKKTQHTFSVSSPSPEGEHRYLLSKDVIPNIKRDWGEIRANDWYVVGAGSVIPDYYDDKQDPGVYSVESNKDILQVEKDELGDWIGGFDTSQKDSTGKIPDWELVDLEEVDIEEGEELLSKLQSEHTAFFSDLMDRLNGGRGSMGDSLNKDGNKIDRSRLDYTCLEHLYGIARYYGFSHSESRGLAGKIYYNFSQEQKWLKDGQKRKWEKRDREYQIDMMDNAIQNYDQSKFVRLMNQTSGSRKNINEYSKITYNLTQFVIDWLANDWDIDFAHNIALIDYDLDLEREQLASVSNTPMYQDTTPLSKGVYSINYPSSKAVKQICSTLDSRSEQTYQTTLQRLRRNGNIKLAYLGGNDYVVYPEYEEDPEEADYIKSNGEKYE